MGRTEAPVVLSDTLRRLKGHAYCVAVRSVSLYGCDIWNLCAECSSRLGVSGYPRLPITAKIGWSGRVINITVRNLILGIDSESTSLQSIRILRFR